jgi:hypothetical protein
MVNGPDRVFIEKADFLQQVLGVSIGERSLTSVTTSRNQNQFSTRDYPMAAGKGAMLFESV